MAAIQSKTTGVTPETRNADASKFYIAIPPVEIIHDPALIANIVQIVNEQYTIAEAGIFDDAYRRTNSDEVTKYITAGQLALASSSVSFPWTPASSFQGCIRIIRLSDTEAELGMLVTAPSARGTGLGRQLMDFGEDHCRSLGARMARLDLLVPATFRHELKVWVQAWYERLGYRMFGLTNFAETYPHLAPRIITETEYRMFAKDL